MAGPLRADALPLDRTNDCVHRDLLHLGQIEDGHADLLHVFRQVHRELLPGVANVTAEFAWLILGTFGGLATTLFHHLPNDVDFLHVPIVATLASAHFVRGWTPHGRSARSHRLDLWFGKLMLPHEMLDKIILPVAPMGAFGHIALPPLKLPMSFILMSDPVGFTLERLRLGALEEGACEGLNILMYVLGPV